MPLTGPAMDAVVKEAVSWYQSTLMKLMDALEEEYPYGTVKTSPMEQLAQYTSMTDDDWTVLFARLERRFRGLPNSRKLVEDEAARYVKRMETIRSKLGGIGGGPVGVPIA